MILDIAVFFGFVALAARGRRLPRTTAKEL
jgi:hypothetical protein